jgi:hypothetical protein
MPSPCKIKKVVFCRNRQEIMNYKVLFDTGETGNNGCKRQESGEKLRPASEVRRPWYPKEGDGVVVAERRLRVWKQTSQREHRRPGFFCFPSSSLFCSFPAAPEYI